MKTEVEEIFTYYLPQFHAIPENDQWWGKGFTEWVKLKSAKKIYKDHVIPQPIEPLGYYDLNDVSVIEKQYKIAKENGITSFCFWHYWFNDHDMLLEKPAELLLKSDIDVKFCFAWANHTWWNKTENKLLKEQHYDFSLESYFNYLLPFFKDKRYTKIDNKPVFFIYDLKNALNGKELIEYFTARAQAEGFDGIYFIGENMLPGDPETKLVNQYLNSCDFMKHRTFIRKCFDLLIVKLQRYNIFIPRIYKYERCARKMNMDIDPNSLQIPVIFPGWDSSIRHGKKGVILKNNSPELFEEHVKNTANIVSRMKRKMLMVKSWNEWAEGNYIEPCNVNGDSYLKIISKYFTTK
ncbi:glycosyltransferase WbsX family protein [Enterobacter sp. SA187]|uniref:glycosyltransferase WbsX family protein n=1 Tax=Enterobacter sp. SA187 TaxID=1914861 RepID=UPI00093404BC|nr:glycoside hydrolase family 99-like domain-containing protein [Enterobacter sp. SA187]